MSYVKRGWDGSDVYLYGAELDDESGTHVIVCSQCPLDEGAYSFWDRKSFQFAAKEGLHAHLEEHRSAGHTVPQSAVDRIEGDDWIP